MPTEEDDMKKPLSIVLFSCVLLMLLLSVGFVCANRAAAETKTLKIGQITSITGPMGFTMKTGLEAVKPAQELMNQRGGITVQGQKYLIEIVTEDDQSTPPGGVAAINRLMQGGVKFIIAPQFAPINMAIAGIAEENKIFRMKSMGIGKDEIGPTTRYMFYGTATTLSIPVCYDFLVKNYPKAKRIAIICPDDPGIKTNIEVAEKEARKRGLDIVFQEAFRVGTEDFYPTLTKAFEKKPDAIDMVVSIAPWAASLVNQARELGFTGPVFAPMLGEISILNSLLDPKNAHDVFHGGAYVLSPKMKPMMKEYRAIVEKDLKTTFTMDHTVILEGLYPLLQGIEKAQSFDTDKVVAAMESMKAVDTIYGPGRVGGQELFGINHVIYRPPMISRIMNGQIEFDFMKQ
jgi:branched-chain amino acid transport system substrate-binding protein